MLLTEKLGLWLYVSAKSQTAAGKVLYQRKVDPLDTEVV